jgi:hypothetical protein
LIFADVSEESTASILKVESTFLRNIDKNVSLHGFTSQKTIILIVTGVTIYFITKIWLWVRAKSSLEVSNYKISD